MNIRLGLIGVGDISGWHVRALRRVGFEITCVASRPKSLRWTAPFY
jgi:prephenate dehydrogenase